MKKVKGFELKDLERFQKFYTDLKEYEKDYFDSFSSFIAREHLRWLKRVSMVSISLTACPHCGWRTLKRKKIGLES